MAERFSPEGFGQKIYDRFPPAYKLDDADNKYALKRYLEACGDGGFKYIIEEQNGLLDLVDPQKCSVQVLYELYKSYGLDLFYGIPEDFLRAFLPNLGQAWAKKGSLDVIEFIVSSLTGIKTETEVSYDQFENPLVTVKLEMDFAVTDYFPDSEQFERILRKFIPFYCDAVLIYAYVYFEDVKIKAREYLLDELTTFAEDCIHIPHAKGVRLFPMLNHFCHFLNGKEGEQFVLNGGVYFEDDPDILVKDEISQTLDEVGEFSSLFVSDFRPMLNTGHVLNKDFILSQNAYVDEYEEDITLAQSDSGTLHSEEESFEGVTLLPVTDEALFGDLNLFILNVGTLNSDTSRTGHIDLDSKSVDEVSEKIVESLDLRVAEDISEDISVRVVSETGNTSVEDTDALDVFEMPITEVATLQSRGIQDVLNKDPLNNMHTYGDRSDVVKDDINIQPVMDIMSVSEGTPVSAFLNGSATLNSFNTNGFSVCDILRYGGGKIEICYS